MNWNALYHDPLWTEFWESQEIQDRKNVLQRALLSGNDSDPHTLGKLRGQLAILEELPPFVQQLAKRQEAEEQAVAFGSTGRQRWSWSLPRIR